MTRADATSGWFGPARSLLVIACALLLVAVACARIDVNDGLEVSGGYDTGLIPATEGGSVAITDPAAPAGAQLEFDPGAPEVIGSTLDELRDDAGVAVEEATTASTDGSSPQPLPEPTFTPAPLPSDEQSDDDRPDQLIIAIGSYHADIPPNSALNIRDEPGGETLAQLPWNFTVKTTGFGVRIDDTTWAEIKPVGTADWDSGWVIFDLLSFGRPEATPTPNDVVAGDPTAVPDPTPTSGPTPTQTPTVDPDDDEDTQNDDDEDTQNDDNVDPNADTTVTPTVTPELTPTVTSTPDTFNAPVADVFIVDFDLSDPEGASLLSAAGTGDVVAKLPTGTQVTIVGATGMRIDGAAWVQVSGNDLTGWIAVTDLQAP